MLVFNIHLPSLWHKILKNSWDSIIILGTVLEVCQLQMFIPLLCFVLIETIFSTAFP